MDEASKEQGEVAPRWSKRRRLEFIEFRLIWQGVLNRKDLKDQFGISDQQASADIAAYQELAPANCVYDRKRKTYLPTENFAATFGPPEAQTYLNELRSVDYGIKTRRESWIGAFPSFATVPYPKRSADVATLRSVLRAIGDGHALNIFYQSLTRSEPTWRWITPHALGYDGHRWHARAFCHRSGDFKDFVLGRILKIRNERPHHVDPSLDRLWAEEVTLRIGTHPKLPSKQRSAVEMDHNMTDGHLDLPVRAALVHYLTRWMRVDLDPTAVSPEQVQVALLNKHEIDDREKVLKQESQARAREVGIQTFGE